MDIKTRKDIKLKIMNIVTQLNNYPDNNVLMAQQRLLDAINWLGRSQDQ
jgi:hypothetical protein